MSVRVGDANRQCPRCHLLMRRFLISEPSLVESPVCRRCFYVRTLMRVKLPPHDPALPYEVPRLRALGRDAEQSVPMRIFALTVLEDKGQADDDDVTLLRLLEFDGLDFDGIEDDFGPEPRPDPSAGVASGGHGAASSDTEDPEAATDTQAESEPGRKPEETTEDDDAEQH